MSNVVDQDQQWLLGCLSATLDPSQEVRSFAEASLDQASRQPGFGSALSKVAANKELAVGLRQLAAVLLKQLVKKHWQEGEDSFEPPVVSSDEKEIIRRMLLLTLDDPHGKICTAIGMAVASIAVYDWPELWPDLLPFLLNLINNQTNLNGVHGAMRCLVLLSADLDDKMVPTLIPALFPSLLTIVSSPQIYDTYIRTKALSIVYSCTSMLGAISGVYKAETSSLIVPLLKPWMEQFSSILENPVQSENPDDWSIRMEVLKCLNQFIQNFSSLIKSEFEVILGPLWNTFVSSLRVYEQASIEGAEDSYEGRYDSDGSEKSLDSFVIQLFELLLTIVGNSRLGKMVVANVKELVYYTIAFLQMTEHQVHTWSVDANQFIADEEDATYSCRISGVLLLEEIVNSFDEGFLAIIDSAKQWFTESQIRKVAGSPSWWRIREATLFALSSLSEQLFETEESGFETSSLKNLIEQIVTEDSLIDPLEYPFLYSRIFTSVAKFSSVISSGVLENFLSAAMKAITINVPPPVKVGACRALSQLLPEAKNEIVQPQLLGLFSSLTDLLNQASDETLHMVLETLHAAVKAGHESPALVEGIISPVILNVWASHVSDPFISIDAIEVLEAIKSIPGCIHPLVSRILPYIGPILNKPQEQADGLVSGSLDLVTMLLKNAPGDVVKAIYDVCFNAVIRIILQSDEHSEIQNATECLSAFISGGRQEVLVWGSDSGSTMRSLLDIASRLLDPNLESSGSLFVGSYILQLILHLPLQMAVHIRDLVAALVRRMQSAQIASLRSSLLVVFARLVHMSVPNVGQFIDLLISIPAEGHDNSFAYVMSEWTKQQGEIQGAYQIKVTTSALALLLTSRHNELTKTRVQGHLIKDLSSGRMIGSAKEVDGLYLFDDGAGFKEEIQSNCLNSILVHENDEIMLWHYRLGHPSFLYLKRLFPKLFKHKNPNLFSCEVCQFAKHHRSSYSPTVYKPSSPFTLIHSDVWGPCRDPTPNGKRWFITFIDDHTRITWVYLMKTKSEVESIFKNFFQMIQTQFQQKVKIFRSDNGREYFNKYLSEFFLENGIIHQSSCVDTPQQNGVAERKNKHLLEVARALLFQNKAPKYLWGEAVLTGTYLINRMPSKILNFSTPFDVFTSTFPNNRLTCTLPPKIFGCTVFVHIHEPNLGKLEPRAKKCVFIGYAPNKKGYKCFDLISKKTYVTMDVTFFEKTPFFSDHLQGGRKEEDVEYFETQNIEFSRNLDFSEIVLENSEEVDIGKTKNLGESSQPSQDSHEHDSPKAVVLEPVIENEIIGFGNKGIQPFDHVYLRKKRPQRIEPNDTQNCQASEDPSGKSLSNLVPLIQNTTESEPVFDNYDLPIAIRKGKRSCTKHPISNFVSYDKLSPAFRAFTCELTKTEIPRDIHEALRVPKWKEAVLEEMKALEKNQTWKKVELPRGKTTVGCKWVFTIKYKADGSVERYKARLVAKGFTQTHGIDYSETFAPVAKLNTIRVLLSLAVNLDWPLQQLDVKNAFLNGDLEEEVYMDSPPGFESQFNQKVCKLQKSLYGLKQLPRAWFERFAQFIKKLGYSQCQSDHTMFVKHSSEGKMAVLIVYVDDIVITGDDFSEINNLKESLAAEFEIKDLGSLKYFLGMEVARSKKGIVVSQQKYILDLLKETGMMGCRPAETPIDPNRKLGGEDKGDPVDTARYQRLVGRLIYLSHTRPDIAFAVSLVSQFMHSPHEEHLEAVYRILRYLKSAPGRGLFFKKTGQQGIEVFTDADWAGSITDRKSTSGYCTFVWGNLVTWRSKKQNVVARSSAEAEYRAMAQGVCEIIWLKRILEELQLPITLPMKLYCDNKAAISISQNPVQHDRTKHVEIDRHFIKEKVDAGLICMPFVPTSQQVADILTKGLFRPNFEFLVGKLGMLDIYAPT